MPQSPADELHTRLNALLTQLRDKCAGALAVTVADADRQILRSRLDACVDLLQSELPALFDLLRQAQGDTESVTHSGTSFRHLGPTLGIPSTAFLGGPGNERNVLTSVQYLRKVPAILDEWSRAFAEAERTLSTDASLLRVLGPLPNHFKASGDLMALS